MLFKFDDIGLANELLNILMIKLEAKAMASTHIQVGIFID